MPFIWAIGAGKKINAGQKNHVVAEPADLQLEMDARRLVDGQARVEVAQCDGSVAAPPVAVKCDRERAAHR